VATRRAQAQVRRRRGFFAAGGALAATLLSACGPGSGPVDDVDGDTPGADDSATPPRPFTRVAAAPTRDVATARLCTWPDESEPGFDPASVSCAAEGFRYADEAPTPTTGPLRVMAFNIERGLKLDALLDAFADGSLPVPDVLLASELDRGCSRTAARDVTGEIAAALAMDAVFGVEFVELPRDAGAGGAIAGSCEHGNAIFSRFPLGNVEVIQHAENLSWYQPPDDRQGGEPRLGGRVMVAADARLGGDGAPLLRLVSIHYESRPESWQGILAAQAAESAALGLAPGGPAVVGGDTNFPFYGLDLTRDDGTVRDPGAAAFFDAGYEDAHAALPYAERPTRNGIVIDLIFGAGVTFSAPAVCAEALCDTLSDHQAVWADVTLAR
jgi:endonuclease/exonuclease/phosphatase family metal-dependent hydrolase